MNVFFIAETAANGFVNTAAQWTVCEAKSLQAAKRAASGARMFQGTTAWVGQQGADGEIHAVAVRRADALDMARTAAWQTL